MVRYKTSLIWLSAKVPGGGLVAGVGGCVSAGIFGASSFDAASEKQPCKCTRLIFPRTPGDEKHDNHTALHFIHI